MSTAADPGLAVVVVNYGSSQLLDRNLSRVQAGVPHAQVVVVDNFSTPSERDRVVALGDQHGWDVVPLEQNRGFGGGMNAGVARALDRGASDVLLLNPDAYVEAPDIARLRAAVRDRRLAAAAPVILDGDGSIWFSGVDLDTQDGSMHRATWAADSAPPGRRRWLTGACVLLTAEAWQATGGFDEDYFLYWEDVDLSHRLADAGGELLVVWDARARHDEGGTQERPSRSRGMSSTYYYFNIRNRLLYASRHLDDAGLRAWRRSSPLAARDILLRGGRRQFLRPGPPVWAAVRGLRDGDRIARGRGRTDRLG